MKLMDIINESTGRKYEYGCVMLYFDFPQINKIHDSIHTDDIYIEDGDNSYGLEEEPHTTLLFGLHNGVTTEDVTNVLKKFKYGECKIHNPSLFENENYDVLKFDVEGVNLHETNELLRDFPHTNNFPDYHPHLTIGYIKSGMGKKYIDKLNGHEYMLSPKEAIYSKPDGSKDKIEL